MNPVDVYLNAIEAMYNIANLYEWNATWHARTTTFSMEARNSVWVRVERELRRLETHHVALAIYYIITQMAERRAFYEYGADLYQVRRLMGGVIVEPSLEARPLNTSIDAVPYADTTNITAVDSTSQSPSLGRTIFFKDLTVTFHYTGGRINSQDLFTAVLGGLADAAKAGIDTVCTRLYAVSRARNLVFWIDGDEESEQPLTYGAATDILKGIAVDMTLVHRRFAVITFIVRNGTDQLATGYIGPLPVQGNGTASAATSR